MKSFLVLSLEDSDFFDLETPRTRENESPTQLRGVDISKSPREVELSMFPLELSETETSQ